MGRPIPCFQEPCAKQAELYDLTADSIDLYPVPDPQPVGAHQNEPAAECQNEILKDYGQSCGHQAQNRWHLTWYAEYDQQNE